MGVVMVVGVVVGVVKELLQPVDLRHNPIHTCVGLLVRPVFELFVVIFTYDCV